MSGKQCGDMRFQQLQYKGLAGDPSSGTAVKMYKSPCSGVDKYDKNDDC